MIYEGILVLVITTGVIVQVSDMLYMAVGSPSIGTVVCPHWLWTARPSGFHGLLVLVISVGSIFPASGLLYMVADVALERDVVCLVWICTLLLKMRCGILVLGIVIITYRILQSAVSLLFGMLGVDAPIV